MEFRRGQQVSLKPNISESWFDNDCVALPRTTGPSNKPKITPGIPAACWHEPCKVIRIFMDNGILIENSYGYVRQADPWTLMQRYD